MIKVWKQEKGDCLFFEVEVKPGRLLEYRTTKQVLLPLYIDHPHLRRFRQMNVTSTDEFDTKELSAFWDETNVEVSPVVDDRNLVLVEVPRDEVPERPDD